MALHSVERNLKQKSRNYLIKVGPTLTRISFYNPIYRNDCVEKNSEAAKSLQ